MFTRQKIDRIPPVIEHKWSKELVEEGYVPFPKRLLRFLSQVFENPDFEVLQVLLAAVDYDRPHLRNPPSLDFLAFLAGLDKATFRLRLSELKDRGLVEVEMIQDVAVEISIDGLRRRVHTLINEEEQIQTKESKK